jgi:hypothetical protein
MRKTIKVIVALASLLIVLLGLARFHSADLVWFLLDLVLQITCGWLFYLARRMPEVQLDVGVTATSLACLAGLAVGLHLVLRWPSQPVQKTTRSEETSVRPWRVRGTGMVLAMVVLLFAAGLSALAVSRRIVWLATTREELIHRDRFIRPASKRMRSAFNLKLIGLAAHNHAAANETLPPGGLFDAQGRALHGWQTLLLPFIEEDSLYRQIDLNLRWRDPDNAEAFQTPVKCYLHPAVIETKSDTGFALSHYAANVRVLGGTTPRTLGSITDGLSNTILAGEVWAAYQPWGYPASWRDPARGIHTTRDSFGSPMRGDSVQFLMADGSVRTVEKRIRRETLQALGTPDGGETIDSTDW